METAEHIQLGILLELFGGFVLVDANSTLPLGLEFVLMATGLLVGVLGATRSA
jgi:hypothetical protein